MRNAKKIKIVVDTNLWISFLIGRKLSCLLELLAHEDIEIVTSKELLDEIYTVLRRPKLAKYFSSNQLSMLEEFMAQETHSYTITNIPRRCRDPKDDYLLELALVSNADYLITGDKDLLVLEKIASCQIVTIIEFESLNLPLGYSSTVHEDIETYMRIVIEQ